MKPGASSVVGGEHGPASQFFQVMEERVCNYPMRSSSLEWRKTKTVRYHPIFSRLVIDSNGKSFSFSVVTFENLRWCSFSLCLFGKCQARPATGLQQVLRPMCWSSLAPSAGRRRGQGGDGPGRTPEDSAGKARLPPFSGRVSQRMKEPQ